MNEQKSNNYILIMAGGVGSRFWPASRESLPKQFLDILGVGKSLLQLTYERAVNLVPKENILIATHKNYLNLVQTHLPEVNNQQLLLEPTRNNTAPCVAYASLKIKALNPNAVFGVWPADHVILKEKKFLEKMQLAFEFAATNEALVTIGIKPTRPDTGYGYIEVNYQDSVDEVERVISFKEKPSLGKAKEYLKNGNYFWNAGIFIWKASTVLNEFERNANQIIDTLSEDLSSFNTEKERLYIDKVYPKTDKISVDYAILENSNQVYTIPADISWSDLGTWSSLYEYVDKDEHGNVIEATFHKVLQSSDNYINVEGDKLIVAKGLRDFIIIDKSDVLLIWPKGEEQEIKETRANIDDERFI
jgi:mannose-1-phosphate guanylyltransferase